MFINQTQVGKHMATVTSAKPTVQAAFPAQVLETSIREFLAEEGAMQAVLHGNNAPVVAGIGPQPVIDSLVVVEILLELETKVPFDLPESLVRAGGYDSVDEVVQHLIPQVEKRWIKYHKEKS
jgi:hypothetical protein